MSEIVILRKQFIRYPNYDEFVEFEFRFEYTGACINYISSVLQ